MDAEDVIKSRNDEHVARRFISTAESARARRLDFNLLLKDVRRLLSTEKCFYTGVTLTRTVSDPTQLTFDRVDNSKGYVRGNVVACSLAFNTLKGNLSVEDIKLLHKGLKKKNLV